MLTREYSSPCGPLLLGCLGESLCICDWMVDGRIEKTLSRIAAHLPSEVSGDNAAILDRAENELDEYFDGYRRKFDVPLIMAGSCFQTRVWRELQQISYSATTSYIEIARAIGRPTAVRAVANAIGSNPLSIFIPCHRILGSDGSLTGYAGGIKAKQGLLAIEQRGVIPREDTPN